MGVEKERAKENILVQDKSAGASRKLHKKDFYNSYTLPYIIQNKEGWEDWWGTWNAQTQKNCIPAFARETFMKAATWKTYA